MTVEDNLKKTIKILQDILKENFDVRDEDWYYHISCAVDFLDDSLKKLEK